MKIESIRLKNFKAFKDAEMIDIPDLCVIVGANGSGKSTIFSVFDFLKEALVNSVSHAVRKSVGGKGLSEVRTRDCFEPVLIELGFREKADAPLLTYSLKINKKGGRTCVSKETLQYQTKNNAQPLTLLDFEEGKGFVVTNNPDNLLDKEKMNREEQTLKANDLLAIKGLAQFERFPVIVMLGNLIENWHVSDFNFTRMGNRKETSSGDHLTREGENLAEVVQNLHQNFPEIFEKVMDCLKSRIPGLEHVRAKPTEDGRILLSFKDGSFKEPFLAENVSDGTIKMLAFLTLLYDPQPHPLLCVEEPENQLYPKLLMELAEEFRAYAIRGGQVFVTTHSPDFLNATELDEVFWLEKQNGYSVIKRAADDPQVAAYMADGDKMGYLWKQGFFGGVDPV